ncbi:MAG TPA: hypothetical protein VEV81_00395 [Pyrinomonadaceae bacterium]|nr:hypothetical protein [Pyrinomonadaceae bacterium]
MVAGGHHVNPGVEELVGQGGRDGKTARDVFGVHHGQVNRVLLAQILDTLEHGDAPGPRDDISDHQDFHKLKVNSE